MYVYVYLFIVYVEFIIGILFLKKSGVGFNYIKILFSSKQRLRTTQYIYRDFSKLSESDIYWFVDLFLPIIPFQHYLFKFLVVFEKEL